MVCTFMLTFEALVGVAALLVGVGNLYYQREAVRLMKASAVSPRRRAEVANLSWWKNRTTALMAVLVLLTWGPFAYNLATQKPLPSEPPPGNYNWGTLSDGEIYYSLPIAETKPDRRLVLTALHYNGLGDIKDVGGIQKSKPYDFVRGIATLIIDPDQRFRNETAAGMKQVTFVLLDTPQNLSPDQFSTIRQATNLGATLLAQRAATHY